jgi:uncharacterized membrane protein YhaH (DUF805 family)
MKVYLAGRAGRREYWIWLATITIATGILNAIHHDLVLWSTISFLPWFVIGTRRLRDFGASPWWVLFPFFCGFAFGFVLAILKGANSGVPLVSPLLGILMAAGVNWAYFIYVGSRRSLPPKPSELAEVF